MNSFRMYSTVSQNRPAPIYKYYFIIYVQVGNPFHTWRACNNKKKKKKEGGIAYQNWCLNINF